MVGRPRGETERITVSRRVDKALWERLQRFAANQDFETTDRAVLERAIEFFLDHHEPKTKREK